MMCSVVGRAMAQQPYTSARQYNLFRQLKNVYNEINNKVLPPYVKLTLPQSGTQGIPLLFQLFAHYWRDL